MIHPFILVIHNALRWLVLGSLLATLINAYGGWFQPKPISRLQAARAQTLRIITTSVAHTQLLVGIYLYTISPIIRYYWKSHPGFRNAPEITFFSLIHSSLMITAIVVMTIGSSKAKRQTDDRQRAGTTAIYFTFGLILILMAVPWPFSPLAARPWVRLF